jgi:hypothetical protein
MAKKVEITFDAEELLRSLTGGANPNPDDSDEPHGPKAPIVRIASLLKALQPAADPDPEPWHRFADPDPTPWIVAGTLASLAVIRGSLQQLPDEGARTQLLEAVDHGIRDFEYGCGTGPRKYRVPGGGGGPGPDPEPRPIIAAAMLYALAQGMGESTSRTHIMRAAVQLAERELIGG